MSLVLADEPRSSITDERALMLLKRRDFAELETTLDRLGGAARAAAVRELADALVASAGTLGPTELRVYDEVIRWLAQRSDGLVRAAVAIGIASAPSGPELTVRDLARDPDPAVATPLLRSSRLVPEADLLAVARDGSEAHLVAIAEREGVGEPVTEVLAASGLRPVLRALAENATARLSPTGLDRLAGAAREDGELVVALLKRRDLPVRLTQDLLRRHAAGHDASGPARRLAVAGAGSQAGPQPTAGSAPPRARPSSRDLRVAEAQAAAVSRHLLLTADDVAWCLDQGRWVESLAVVARLAEYPTERVARAFVERKGPAMLASLFLAGARWEVVERALLAWGATTSNRLAEYAAAYDALTRPAAERALRADSPQTAQSRGADEK